MVLALFVVRVENPSQNIPHSERGGGGELPPHTYIFLNDILCTASAFFIPYHYTAMSIILFQSRDI